MSKAKDNTILQLYGRTPAPCRDYCGLTVTKEDIILNIWNVTHGPHVYPKRYKCALPELSNNKYLKMEIGRVFGKHVLEYTDCLSKNEMKLENLSTKAFLSVLKYLAAKDILNLSQTSKIMFERCNDNTTWGIIFRKFFKRAPTEDDLHQIERKGWRTTLKEKLGLTHFDSKTTQLTRRESDRVLNNAKVKNKAVQSDMTTVRNITNPSKKITKEIPSKILIQVKSETNANVTVKLNQKVTLPQKPKKIETINNVIKPNKSVTNKQKSKTSVKNINNSL